MSGIRLLASSVLDGSTVTVSSGAGAVYLNDHDAGPQWVAAGTGAQTITVDATTIRAVRALALVHHNLLGVAVQLQQSDDGLSWTNVGAAIPVTTDPFTAAVSFGLHRYWRLAIPAGLASAAAIGELLFGAAHDVVDNPNLPTGKPAIVGNVARDRSPAGYPWNTRKGLPRRRYPYRWNALPDTDLAELVAAYGDCDEGTWPVVLTDQLGTVLWVTWEDAVLGPPDALGKQLQQVAATFEEIPQ